MQKLRAKEQRKQATKEKLEARVCRAWQHECEGSKLTKGDLEALCVWLKEDGDPARGKNIEELQQQYQLRKQRAGPMLQHRMAALLASTNRASTTTNNTVGEPLQNLDLNQHEGVEGGAASL